MLKITLVKLKDYTKRMFFNKRIYLLLVLVFAFLIQHSNLYSQYKIRTVVIDAGHGGKDPGAIGKKSKEKDLALSIALKVGSYIEQYMQGVKVIYTRKKDVFIELYKRAEIANKANADVFMSIHINSHTSSQPYGTATYVMGVHKSEDNLEVAKKENSVILKEKGYKKNYKGFDPNSAESHIIFTLLQNAYLEQSLNLAGKIQNQFKTRVGRKDLGVRQAGLVVLWNATMPSVLIETGFISNSKEEKYLMTDEGQTYIASGIYRAFKEYKIEIEKNSKAIKPKIQTTNTNQLVKNTNQNHGITFRVQIKSSTSKINEGNSQLKGFKDVKEEYYKGVYKYYVGESDDFKEIVKIQSKVREKVADAFVVAFKNSKRISLKEALNQIKGN